MPALRTILSRLRLGDPPMAGTAAGDGPGFAEKRRFERRMPALPLQDRESRLRFAAQAAGFGTYDLNCLTGESHFSPELLAIAGLPPDQSPLTVGQVAALLHPEDRDRVLTKLHASLDPHGSGEIEDEQRLLRPDGSERWVRVRGRTFFTGTGDERRPAAATGVVMDITASRSAEQGLRRSQQDLELAVHGAAMGTWNWNLRTGEMTWSDRSRQLLAIPDDEPLSYERFLAALHPDDRDRVTAGVRQALGEKSEVSMEYRALWPDGSIHWIAATGRVYRDENTGEALRMTGVATDISERKATEDRLRQQAMLLDLTPDPIMAWESGKGILYWNKGCEQLYGYSKAEAVGRLKHVLLRTVFPSSLADCLSQLRKTGYWSGDLRQTPRDGREVVVESRMQRLNIDGRLVILEASRDITERKRLEETLKRMNEELESRIEERTAELVRANEALERSNLELQQFAFIAAHDLQTPLRSISGFAQLLQKDYQGRLDPQADTWLHRLISSAQRMHDLIRDLLAYSRVEPRGSVFRPIDFGCLCDDVVATLDTALQDSGAQVTRGDLPVVMGDRTQLGQVLQNLIDNGIKYRGDEPPRVHVSAHRQEGEWLFSVRDNGIGIADKHQERIFEIFHRLHTQQQYPGTGIGLAVCRRVIHRHGGRIWVESEPGQGSVFRFTLPDRGPTTD